MAAELQGLVDLLQQSLDPKQHKHAEEALRNAETTPGFSVSLLQIVATDAYQQTSRLAAALCFKNLIRRKWTDEEGTHCLPEDEVQRIKRDIVGLMISCPSTVQAQLGDAIGVIADSDFFRRWDTLVDDLVSRLGSSDPKVNNGVLQVAHSIFKRWRPLFPSDELFTEINHVQDRFVGPFLKLLEDTDVAIQQNETNKPVLEQYMSTMNISMKILHDLSSQELVQTLVDSLPGILTLLDKYVKYENKLLHSDDEAEPGPLEYLRATIFGLLSLYVTKYNDDIKDHVNGFTGSTWTLLTTTGLELKYDIMASRALGFLERVCSIQEHAQLFGDADTINTVVEKVVLPNIALRESDVELFEDEPIEFIRRDLEGTDSETRRRAATDLLRMLMQQFQERVTRIAMRYIDHYLQDYTRDQSSNWRSKDTAVYLFCSIAPLEGVSSARGINVVNPHVDVIEFFQKSIAQDLVSESAHAILQVDAIKFLYLFRSQLTPQHWQEALPMLVQHLSSSNYVVHTYCAIAIERILYLTDMTNEPIIPRANLLPLSKDILSRLFMLMSKDTAPEKVQENEFLMRAVMRIIISLKDDTVQHSQMLINNLINFLRVIRHNPSNPRFYYYLFEAIGAFIKFTAAKQAQQLEESLLAPFTEILQNLVIEFMPYVFQLLAALLEAQPTTTLPNSYTSLIQPALHPSLWEQRGNVPALTRLVASMVARGPTFIVENNLIEPVLGVFQNLNAKKTTDSLGFDLLEAIVAGLPVEKIQSYFANILQLLLSRLSTSKTESFTIRFVRFYYFVAARDNLGTDFFINIAESIQSGIFAQIYTQIIMPETQKLSRPIDRKVAVVALTKTLADSTAFAEKYQKGWGYTCEALLKLMINPPIPPKSEDLIIQDQDVDDSGFGVGFTQLSTCRPVLRDPYPEVTDVKQWIGKYLRAADSRHGGRIGGFVNNRLNPDTKMAFMSYLE
ncbi:MAG: importin-alpha export receptor [Chrysothrix sp. TS-e1954]|nr:MAG: importin-alpha export receptor [Chrysothrix sp. TS-e1954]